MLRREVLLCLLALVTLSHAATWTVTNNHDSGAGSLRALVAGAASGDTIQFRGSMTITLTSGTINIDKSLYINGDVNNNGFPDDVTISGNWTYQIFLVSASSTFFGLRLVKGAGVQGGAIFTFASATYINRCYIAHCTSIDNGGGVEVAQFGATTAMLSVIYTTFFNNTAAGAGGAIGNNNAYIRAHGNLFQNNRAYHGGAIGHWNAGQTTIFDSTFSGNQAVPSNAGLSFHIRF